MTAPTLIEENRTLLSFSYTSDPFKADSTTRTDKKVLPKLMEMITNKPVDCPNWQISTETFHAKDNAHHSISPSTYGDNVLKHTKELLIFLESEKSSIEHRYMSEQFLTEALEELMELDDYAKEEGFDPPSPIAKELARKLL